MDLDQNPSTRMENLLKNLSKSLVRRLEGGS
jgi:hypothetical protein